MISDEQWAEYDAELEEKGAGCVAGLVIILGMVMLVVLVGTILSFLQGSN